MPLRYIMLHLFCAYNVYMIYDAILIFIYRNWVSTTIVRSVLTYASETTAETTYTQQQHTPNNSIHPTTAYTQQLLRTIEMKTIRAIHGKTLRDKIRSDQLRQLSGIQDIIKWTNVRRKEWDAHVERMEDNRLAKIARDNRPQGVRSRGRQKKPWKESLNAAPSP